MCIVDILSIFRHFYLGIMFEKIKMLGTVVGQKFYYESKIYPKTLNLFCPFWPFSSTCQI